MKITLLHSHQVGEKPTNFFPRIIREFEDNDEPKCKSVNTCEISYGYPGDEEEYLKLVAEKKIYPGGCCIEDDSPAWYCNNCENKWGRYSNGADF